MSEAVMMGLAPILGKADAHHLVYESASNAFENKISLKESLMLNETVMKSVTEEELDRLLNPINYTGICNSMIDQVLKKTTNE